ncbi:MAG: hypothetical protein K2P81_02760 [Bacteriovoracaceae bacterium]|nr:hypothetical protein [Bacteriovoracaceae bacterium]
MIISFLIFVLQVHALEIKIPKYLNGVIEDKSASSGNYYVYNAEVIQGPKKIIAKNNKNLTAEELASSLVFAYESNDKNLFLSLFTPKAKNQIQSLPPAQFEQLWKSYLTRKNWTFEFMHSHKNGHVIVLKSQNVANPNVQFAVKAGGRWFFDLLEIDENDLRFQNIGLWFNYQPMIIKSAQILKPFKLADLTKTLEVQITEKYILVLRKNKSGWEILGQVKDNETDFSAWIDENKAPGLIKINITDYGTNEKTNGEILVLESSFPIASVPTDIALKGQFTP